MSPASHKRLRHLSLPGRVGLGLLGIVVLAGLVEVGARVLLPPLEGENWYRQLEPWETTARPCFEQEERGDVPVLVGATPENQGVVRPLVPREENLRVALVGEGSGVVIGTQLQHIIKTRVGYHEGPYVELLPCANGDVNVDQLRGRIDEVLQYTPDVVWVVFGHNLGFSSNPFIDRSSWRLSKRLYVSSRALVALFGPPVLGPEDASETGPDIDGLKAVLAEAGVKSKAAGVKLMTTRLASNLHYAPESQLSPESEVALWSALFRLDAGEEEAGRKALETLAETEDKGLAAFLLGEHLLASGDAEGGRRWLQRALEQDPLPVRATPKVTSLLEAAGDDLFDLQSVVEGATGGAVPGWEQFVDAGLPKLCVAHDAALAVLEHLGSPTTVDLVCDPSKEPYRPITDAISGRANFSPFQRDRLRIAGQVEAALKGADDDTWDELLDAAQDGVKGLSAAQAGDALADLALGAWKAGEPGRALDLLASSVGVSAEACFVRARVHLSADRRDEARQDLEAALVLKPEHVGAKVYLRALTAAG